MTSNEIQIIIEIIAVAIGLYLAFFKSYFEERGKIVATKKDIEEVTQKVEKVKSEIEILTHQEISLSTEKQNTLLDFANKYATWLNGILYTSLSGGTEDARLYAEKVTEKFDQLFQDFLIAESKLDIFFNDDKELLSLKDRVKLKTIEMSNDFSLALIEVRTENMQLAIVHELPNQPNNSYKMDQLNKHYSTRREAIKKYSELRLEKYKPLAILNAQLNQQISKRVYGFQISNFSDNTAG